MNYKPLFLLVSMLILTACSTLKLKTDFDPEASFVSLKTYAWLPEKFQPSGDPKLDSNQLMHKRIHTALESWFKERGYSKLSRDKADFLIGYYVVVEQKTQVSVLHDSYVYPHGWGRYGSPYYSGGAQTYAYEFDQGTMIIDIINNKTHKLMWRGTAVDEIKTLNTPEEKTARIREVVDKILAEYPPEK